MIVKSITVHKYEMHGPRKQIAKVDLATNECSCKKFQLSQIVCTHVVVIARFHNFLNYYPWVNKYYLTECQKVVYKESVKLLRDLFEWEQPEEI